MTDLMWYKPGNESSIATPCMLLFPDRIEENIRRMILMAGGAERLRPHVKTHKIAEVIELQLQAGINRFKCATLSEVAMVAGAGGRDMLLAYPLLGPAIGLWFDLMDRFPESRLSVTVDSEAALKFLDSEARIRGKEVDLFVDIDNGMHRTGTEPEGAPGLIAALVKKPNLRLRGLHIYDGHIHEPDPEERKAHCDGDFAAINTLVEQLEQDGIASEMTHPRLHFLDLKTEGVINHSEEHLVVKTNAAKQLSIGDVVHALPSHICPTMALQEEVYIVRNQQVAETWKVLARKRSYPL